MTHPPEGDLVAYVRGELSEAEVAALEAHLDACPECDDRLGAIGPPPLRPEDLERAILLDFPCAPVAEGAAPRVEGYDVRGVLGRGGMGVVYKAWHRKFGVVALKVLPNDLLASGDDVSRARREAIEARDAWEQARASGDPSPPFARVYEVGDCEAGPFIAMELATGGSLAGRLGELEGEPDRAAEILRAVALAVHAMHLRGVIHRDIKPSNILLRRKVAAPAGSGLPRSPLEGLEPIVSDFGLARRTDAAGHTATGLVRGSPPYLAPELIVGGAAGPSVGTDIFALGVVLYETLAGRRPFADREGTPFGLQAAIVRDPPSRPRRHARHARQVPKDLAAICLQCLEKRRDRRYRTALDLADDLGRYLGTDPSDPVRARLPGAGRRLGRWCLRNWAAIVVSLSCVGLAWGMWKARDAAQARASEATESAKAAQARTRLIAERGEAQRRAAHESRVVAARSAASRGNWPAALGQYALAVADHSPDELALRVERLFGFFALGDEASLASELAWLEGRSDLGHLAAQVHLARGACLMCDASRQDEGREAIRAALRDRADLRLSPADPAFAEALAETRPARVVRSLEEAVRLDPLHFPARSSLAVALIATGELAEARRQCALMRGLFPAASQPDFMLALIDLIEGDRPAMRRGLDALDRRPGVDHGAVVRLKAYCEGLADTLDLFDDFRVHQGGLGAWDGLRLGLGLARLRRDTRDAIRPFSFPVPTVGMVFRWIEIIIEAWRSDGDAGRDDDYRRLVALGQDHPDALLQAMAARNRLVALIGPLNRAELPRSRELLAEMIRRCGVAAEAPTLIPRSPIRYQARILGSIGDITLLKIAPEPGRDTLIRLRDNLHRMIAEGRRWPRDREEGLDLLFRMLVVPMTGDQARGWGPEAPEQSADFRARRRQILQIGRELASDWLTDDPANASALRWGAELDRLLHAEDR